MKHFWVKGTQGCTNKEHSIIKKEDGGFFLSNKHYDIITALRKCINWFELVSQVSNVAHRTPVVNWPTKYLCNFIVKWDIFTGRALYKPATRKNLWSHGQQEFSGGLFPWSLATGCILFWGVWYAGSPSHALSTRR